MNILITGAHGFVGKHVTKQLHDDFPEAKLFTPTRSVLDLRLYPEIVQYMGVHEITHMVHLAARVGGIGANKRYPARFFYDNLYLSVNMMHAAANSPYMEKFVNVGTICSYPKDTPVPFKESDLWNGYPEETNAPYGVANKAAIVYGEALNQEYNFRVVNLLPVNMSGEGDHYNPEYSHVIPAMILKIDKAIDNGYEEVKLWGTGQATREFLYAGDMAKAVSLAIRKKIKPDPINIGTGKEITIFDLAHKIAKIMKYEGKLVFTGQVSDGQPRRCLDVTKAKDVLGFEATTPLDEMIKKSLADYYERKNGLLPYMKMID